jgi:signal transduction histidine kinase
LQSWRGRVERDPDLSSVSQFTRAQFVDHMPRVLEALAQKLLAYPSEDLDLEAAEKSVESHSKHRWQQGYDLRNLVGEWGHLHTCLVEAVETFFQAHPEVSPEVMVQARYIVAEFFSENITEGVTEYHQLLQSEAATRMRELELGLEKLQALDRTRGQLLRTSLHDLQGSLGIVTGNVAMMDHERLTNEDREEMRQLIQQGVTSLKDMFAELMDLARLEAGQEKRTIGKLDAGQLLVELCATARPLAREKNLYLNARGPEHLHVQGDDVKVRRIAQNLVLNALKYTSEGGVRVFWGEDGERWFLAVEDTGPGLHQSTAAPLASKLAEATETAKEVEGGSTNNTLTPEKVTPPQSSTRGEGVGLSIVKRLCDLLDATLELESQEQVGSTFRVFFPRSYNQTV